RHADSRRGRDERIEHWPELGTRLADDPENLGGRGELLDRVITLAGELCDLGVFAGNRSTSFARWLWRAPLRLVRWLGLRCLKARGPTPFHLGASLGEGPQPSTATGELCSTAKLGRLRRLRVGLGPSEHICMRSASLQISSHHAISL